MRCPGCDKFASLESADPEVEIQISQDKNGAMVSATVRIVRTSECCGEEMKEATFEPSAEIAAELLKDHFNPETGEPLTEDCELEIDDGEDAENTERTEGKGRGLKSFYGFQLHWSVKCGCGRDDGKTLAEGTFTDDIQASHMDELS